MLTYADDRRYNAVVDVLGKEIVVMSGEGNGKDAGRGAPLSRVQLELEDTEMATMERELDRVEPPLHSDEEVATWARKILADQQHVLKGLPR
jgi:hypothetical protein